MTNHQKVIIIADIKEQLSKIGENAPADIQALVAEAIGKLSDLERSLMSFNVKAMFKPYLAILYDIYCLMSWSPGGLTSLA